MDFGFIQTEPVSQKRILAGFAKPRVNFEEE